MNQVPPSQQFPYSSEVLRQNSTLAIISLIGGLSFFIGIPVIGSVVGVVTGNLAMKEIRSSNGLVSGENLAKIGIATGWFGIGVWALGIICGFLAALMGIIPALSGICVATFPFLAEVVKLVQ